MIRMRLCPLMFNLMLLLQLRKQRTKLIQVRNHNR